VGRHIIGFGESEDFRRLPSRRLEKVKARRAEGSVYARTTTLATLRERPRLQMFHGGSFPLTYSSERMIIRKIIR